MPWRIASLARTSSLANGIRVTSAAARVPSLSTAVASAASAAATAAGTDAYRGAEADGKTFGGGGGFHTAKGSKKA